TRLPGSNPLRGKRVPVLFSAPFSTAAPENGSTDSRPEFDFRRRGLQRGLGSPSRSAMRGLRERLHERVRVRAVRSKAVVAIEAGEPRGHGGGRVVLAALQASSLRCPAPFAAVAWHLAAVSGLVQPFLGVQCRARRATVVRPGLKGREIPAEVAPTSESPLVLSCNQPLTLTIQWEALPS
ncbi:hypothetical protein BJ912DRAFT_971895, partial [Pholiota molesta]